MKICITGGGNIGTLMAAEFSLDKNNDVTLLTSKAQQFVNDIIIEDKNNNTKIQSHVNKITSNIAEAVEDAEIIFITQPPNIVPKILEDIYPFVKNNTMIGIIPGSGGAEFFYYRHLIKKDCIFFGIQRVHSIARLKEVGKIVTNLGRKNEIYVSALKKNDTKKIASILEKLFKMPCIELDNYLCVTFTPSNQILHTARLYGIFKNLDKQYFDDNILFYRDWDNFSSEILIKCDKELQNICKKIIQFDLREVKSLLAHYGVNSVDEMTHKISNISAFQNISSPLKKMDGKYFPDKENRYFIADFPYGLCIIKGFAAILEVDTPTIDILLRWYEKFANVEYFNGNEFHGRDVKNTGAPQAYNINTFDELLKIYNQ